MARLTNAMRDDIVARVLSFKFNATREALDREAQKVFDAVADVIQGEHKAAIDKLPLEWFKLTEAFEVTPTLPATGRGRHFPITVRGAHPRPLADKAGRWRSLDEKVVGPEAYGLALAYANKCAEYFNERGDLEAKLRALVHSVTTTTKLYEAWPELSEIVPEPETASKSSVGTALTVSVAELNKAIPLPRR